jgi:hypothetical protein
MATARLIQQLVVVAPNEVGTLAAVCDAAASCGSAIHHVCAAAMGRRARFMLSVEEPDRLVACLEEAGYEVSVTEVLEIEFANAAGVLAPVARALSEAGIDILFNYGTSADGRKAVIVLSTNDDEQALEIINGES